MSGWSQVPRCRQIASFLSRRVQIINDSLQNINKLEPKKNQIGKTRQGDTFEERVTKDVPYQAELTRRNNMTDDTRVIPILLNSKSFNREYRPLTPLKRLGVNLTETFENNKPTKFKIGTSHTTLPEMTKRITKDVPFERQYLDEMT
ncbi:hypothetical protein RUM44_004931 [Polyplax serrata]|uniref:Uncharacterized protein n=1 Tax=Polyplax serrata TaxID=468196 RepID=A0ABR1AWG1_POLSC